MSVGLRGLFSSSPCPPFSSFDSDSIAGVFCLDLSELASSSMLESSWLSEPSDAADISGFALDFSLRFAAMLASLLACSGYKIQKRTQNTGPLEISSGHGSLEMNS